MKYIRDKEEQDKHIKSRTAKMEVRKRTGRGSYVLAGDKTARADRAEAPGDVVVSRDFRSSYFIHTDGSRRKINDQETHDKCVNKVKEIMAMTLAAKEAPTDAPNPGV